MSSYYTLPTTHYDTAVSRHGSFHNPLKMDKNSIKKYAIFARTELLKRVTQKAAQYEITATSQNDLNAERIGTRLLDLDEKRQYRSLVRKIKQVGFAQAMEEAAYTWFNRFCALRFMEVNGYLPSHIRVFTDESNTFNPQILTEAIQLGEKFDNIDMNRVFNYIEKADAKGQLYQYLLVTQCNALQNVLPGIFAKIEDYTELLFPNNLLDKDSVLGRLISDIPEEYFCMESEDGQIEIIGWLYQYYISDKREEVIDPLHGKFIRVEDIPAATQVFTTDWVVRYITDNSVGRYWLDHNPNSSLATELAYLVKNDVMLTSTRGLKPQDVTVFDPCVGSGHFLVYAIDVLMKIYREYGYSDRDAISEIISHNIFGLDIDERSVEMAYFAIMMKGCQYDKRFLRRGIHPQIYKLSDSQFVDEEFVNYFCENNTKMRNDVLALIEKFKDGLEAGSLVQIPPVDCEALAQRAANLGIQKNLFYHQQLVSFTNLIHTARLLSSKYAAVITNPPYLNKYDLVLKAFLNKNYKDYAGDLFSVFVYKCTQFCVPKGYTGLMTPNVWMFIKSYEKLRRYIITNHSITTLVQMAKGAFFSEATVDVCAFVIQCQTTDREGIYFRLEAFSGNMDDQNEKLVEALADPSCNYKYCASSSLFKNLPGMPIGYWAGEQLLKAFKTGHALETNASPRQGLATTDNNKYLRHWYEVDHRRIGFGLDKKAAMTSDIKWFPYNKGGEFRKWYGNQDYIVNYQHDGAEIKNDVLTKYPYLKTPDFVVKNPDTYFSPSLSWSKISSGSAAFRYFPQGFLYDVSGCSIFFDQESDLLYDAGFLNGAICAKILEIISPTLNYETGHIAILPIIESDEHKERVEQLVKENIELSKEDWNNSELSWAFKKHVLI